MRRAQPFFAADDDEEERFSLPLSDDEPDAPLETQDDGGLRGMQVDEDNRQDEQLSALIMLERDPKKRHALEIAMKKTKAGTAAEQACAGDDDMDMYADGEHMSDENAIDSDSGDNSSASSSWGDD